jgi:hypothetical protein
LVKQVYTLLLLHALDSESVNGGTKQVDLEVIKQLLVKLSNIWAWKG